MIVIERILRTEAKSWEEAQGQLRRLGIVMPDYAMKNVEAGRPFTAQLSTGYGAGRHVTVRYEPDADR